MINLFLLGLNLAMAAYSGSLVLMAEEAHNLADLAASGAVGFGLTISQRKSPAFPYGLYKIENVAAIIVGLFLFLTAYGLRRRVHNMSVSSAFARESEVAAHLAKQAGDVIMRIYATDFSVDYKAKNDPVTEADRLASRVIVEGLQHEFPDDMVVSEEEPIPALASAPDRVWYVDPLDGTHEFIKRNGEFAVMIGLAVDGRPRVGVVFRPVTAELFWGIVRDGAWLETKEAKRPLRVSSEIDPSRLRLVASRSHRDHRVDEVRRRLGISEESRMGSVGIKVGLLVTRQADIYLEPSSMTKTWDSCAPEAILHAGGGRMTDLEGAPLRYVPSEVRNWKGIVATNGVCHDRVISEIAYVVREHSQ